jgi:hypothetical protein
MVSLSTSAGPDRLALLQDFQARGGDRPHAGRLDGARRPVLALLTENVHGDVRWLGEVEGLGAVAHHRAGDRLAVGQGGHPVLSPRGISHQNLALAEIHILDPQPRAFHR